MTLLKRSPPRPRTRSPKAGPAGFLNRGARPRSRAGPGAGKAPGSRRRRGEARGGWFPLGVPGSPPTPVPPPPILGRNVAEPQPGSPGGATPKGGGGGSPLPGLPRLPGDDNFPATGSSWPGSAALPPRAPGEGHAVPAGGWRRRQRAPSGPVRPAGGLRARPRGDGRAGLRAGPLTGAAGVAAASGSRAPGAGARSPPPAPPAAAASPQWLGLGLGGSPESGLSRTPSPFFFVSTSSGTSCRLRRPTMAARRGPGGRAGERGARGAQTRAGPLPAGRPPCPPPARRPGLAGRRAPRPASAPPRPGPAGRRAVRSPSRGAGARGRCAPARRRLLRARWWRGREGRPSPRPAPPPRSGCARAPARPGPLMAPVSSPCPSGPAGANVSSPRGRGEPASSPGLRRPGEPAEPSEQTTGKY